MSREDPCTLYFDVIGPNGRLARFNRDNGGIDAAVEYALEHIAEKPYVTRTCVNLRTGEDEYQDENYSKSYSYENLLKDIKNKK